MDRTDLADEMLALTHGVTLQRPQPKSGAPFDAGCVIDKLMKMFTRAQSARK